MKAHHRNEFQASLSREGRILMTRFAGDPGKSSPDSLTLSGVGSHFFHPSVLKASRMFNSDTTHVGVHSEIIKAQQ